MGNQTDEQSIPFLDTEPDTFLEDGGLIFNASSVAELDLLIERVNKRYFYVVIGTNGYIGYREYDPLLKREVIHYITPHTFHELCATTYVRRHYLCDDSEEPRVEQVTQIWMKHSNRRQYTGVVFSPDQALPRNKFNLWQDFRKDAKAGDCSPFLNFISEVICNRNSDHYNYVVAWMADAVQNITANNKPGVALVLRGERGTGKGFFANQFGSLFKQYYIHITQPDHLVGKFNRHFQDCLLLFVDEMSGNKQHMGAIQGLITEPTFMIEIKGKDAFQALNYMRIMVASNFDWVVPAGPNERRWAVIDVSNCHMQDSDYFSNLDHHMKNGGREAFLDYLLRYDYSKIALRKIPKTSALAEQILSTMDNIEECWYDLLQEATYPRPSHPYNPPVEWGEEPMIKKAIYNDYVEKTKKKKGPARNETAFWSRIRKLCPSLKEARDSRTENKRGFDVPSLKEARNLFDKFFGQKFEWGE